MPKVYVTDHFTVEEISCHCGCKFMDYDPRQLGAMEFLRALAGVPLPASSWCRCPKHNKAEGGRPRSQHLLGRGTDIKPVEIAPIELARLALEVPAFARGGIGVYDWGCHFDCRGYPARWGWKE